MHYSWCQDVVLETFQSQFLELASVEQLFLRDLNLRFKIMGMIYNIILLQLKDREAYELYNKSQTNLLECSHWTQVRLVPCLVSQSLSQFLLLLNFAQIVGSVKVVRWISLSCFIDFFKTCWSLCFQLKVLNCWMCSFE